MIKTFSLTTSDGITLALDCVGDPNAPAVLLSHGGGQTRHAWGNTAKRLAANGWYAVSYDHRGHGGSSWCDKGAYNLETFAADQLAVVKHLGGNVVIIGASMGGIAAMSVAGELAPELIRAVVLVDIAPQMNRRGTDKILDFMSANVENGFANLEEAAETIAKYTGRERPANPKGLRKNLRQKEDGRYYWHWDPAMVNIRGKFSEASDRLINCCKAIPCPWFLVRGLQSDIVPEHVFNAFQAMFPEVKTVTIERARHMVAGDRNDIFADEILTLLENLA